MVNLTRIYTRTGDAGTTRLSDNSVVAKTDLRVAAYGDVDEANSALGVALSIGGIPEEMNAALRLIQNELFDVGADLSNPLAENPAWPPLRIEQSSIDRLEGWCDTFGAPLGNLASFILPGGTPAAAHLHVARTLTRRAERTAWAAAQEHGLDEWGGVNKLAITYLNRLSDLLFIAARAVNAAAGNGDVLWVPGTDRAPEGTRAERTRARIDAASAE